MCTCGAIGKLSGCSSAELFADRLAGSSCRGWVSVVFSADRSDGSSGRGRCAVVFSADRSAGSSCRGWVTVVFSANQSDGSSGRGRCAVVFSATRSDGSWCRGKDVWLASLWIRAWMGLGGMRLGRWKEWSWFFTEEVCNRRSEVSRRDVGGTTGEASGWANGAYHNDGLQPRYFRDGMWMRKGWRLWSWRGCVAGNGVGFV